MKANLPPPPPPPLLPLVQLPSVKRASPETAEVLWGPSPHLGMRRCLWEEVLLSRAPKYELESDNCQVGPWVKEPVRERSGKEPGCLEPGGVGRK